MESYRTVNGKSIILCVPAGLSAGTRGEERETREQQPLKDMDTHVNGRETFTAVCVCVCVCVSDQFRLWWRIIIARTHTHARTHTRSLSLGYNWIGLVQRLEQGFSVTWDHLLKHSFTAQFTFYYSQINWNLRMQKHLNIEKIIFKVVLSNAYY